MSKFWSSVVNNLKPYTPGEQPKVPGLIKLNTNEHCLPPSTEAMAALGNVSSEALRRYPDPESTALRRAIANAEGLAEGQVFVGNGSDEVLAHIFQGLLSSNDSLVAPDITYSFYPVWAALYGLELKTEALLADFTIDVNRLLQHPESILLANPNAPTGRALTLAEIKRLVDSNPDRLVVVDEAYYGFGADSASSLLTEAENLIVTRSLSKSHALAGLRVGYALGSAELIEGLIRVKDSFNSYPLDACAQSVATAAIEDTQWLSRSSALVTENRDRLTQDLRDLGFEVCPSLANFIFVQHPQHEGRDLFEYLRAKNILVRRWDKKPIANFLRITVGTHEECSALVQCLKERCAP
ncbi:histidinol-phosphate transaminase [Luminiphilus sp. nBUS_16]|uniref:histidinol-phosphate transaminase n=1 Tax=Luminiphilus sp. nBUS_16 TaxID=3395315 RepID=UPI003EBDB5F1